MFDYGNDIRLKNALRSASIEKMRIKDELNRRINSLRKKFRATLHRPQGITEANIEGRLRAMLLFKKSLKQKGLI